MSNFKELLKKPLPSKISGEDTTAILESPEIEPVESELEDTNNGGDQANSDEIDLNDIPDDIPETEIDDLEDEIASISEDDLNELEDEKDDEDEEKEVNLSKEEEIEADKFMSLVATPTVLKSELTESECKEFAESVELNIAIDEGFILESDKESLLCENEFDFEGLDMIIEAAKFAPKTKVMFSLQDRKKQLFEVGVAASARAHNDRDYAKLQKVYRLERILKKKLRKKYKAEALKRVKAYIIRLKKSRSGILSKIADKITGK